MLPSLWEDAFSLVCTSIAPRDRGERDTRCGGSLYQRDDITLVCGDPDCRTEYHVRDGVPALISHDSVVPIAEYDDELLAQMYAEMNFASFETSPRPAAPPLPPTDDPSSPGSPALRDRGPDRIVLLDDRRDRDGARSVSAQPGGRHRLRHGPAGLRARLARVVRSLPRHRPESSTVVRCATGVQRRRDTRSHGCRSGPLPQSRAVSDPGARSSIPSGRCWRSATPTGCRWLRRAATRWLRSNCRPGRRSGQDGPRAVAVRGPGGILVLADPFQWQNQTADRRIYSFDAVSSWLDRRRRRRPAARTPIGALPDPAPRFARDRDPR